MDWSNLSGESRAHTFEIGSKPLTNTMLIHQNSIMGPVLLVLYLNELNLLLDCQFTSSADSISSIVSYANTSSLIHKY